LSRLVAKAGEVPPPHIVNEDENEVGAGTQGRNAEKTDKEKGKETLHEKGSVETLLGDSGYGTC